MNLHSYQTILHSYGISTPTKKCNHTFVILNQAILLKRLCDTFIQNDHIVLLKQYSRPYAYHDRIFLHLAYFYFGIYNWYFEYRYRIHHVAIYMMPSIKYPFCQPQKAK
jgi:hypothetical protein